MTWRIFITESSESDLDRLSEDERSALAEDLFAWVAAGPPRRTSRWLAGAEVFEDRLPSGLAVTYFVDEREPYVAILRVGRA